MTAAIANALLDLSRAVRRIEGADWALIGSQALIAYGVPRETLDADALVSADALGDVATLLVETFGWTPLVYDEKTDNYVASIVLARFDDPGLFDVHEVAVTEPIVHFMDDPVLYDVHEERRMIPLRTPLGLPSELLAAQHPVEQDMLDGALLRTHHGISVPVAPLGGILLVKMKADRKKDVAAIEQTAEHLPKAKLQAAIAWAQQRDPSTAEAVAAVMHASRARRVPLRKDAYRRHQR